MPNNVVGTAYVRLRLLTDSIGKDIAKAVQKGDLQDLDIKVKADTAEAEDSLDNVSKKAKEAEKSFHPLLDSALLFGPALEPIIAGAAAAGAGFVAMAGVGILAFKGIQAEMKAGTQTGHQYQQGIASLQLDLSKLEATAARGTLKGFQQSVSDINRDMPMLNTQVGILSRSVGDTLAHAVGGVTAGLGNFGPLLQHVVDLADQGAQAFERWAKGPGGAEFANALGKGFDQAVPLIENLVNIGVKAWQAFNPGAKIALQLISDITVVLNHLPVGVLQAFALGLLALRVASNISTIMDKAGAAIDKLGANVAGADSKMAGFGGNLAMIGTRVGVFAVLAAGAFEAGQQVGKLIFDSHNLGDAVKVANSAQGSFYDALVQSNGAVDQGVKQVAAYAIAQDGLGAKANAAGITQGQLTDAILGSDTAYEALIRQWKASGQPAKQTIDKLNMLRDAFVQGTQTSQQYLAQQINLVHSKSWEALNTTAQSVEQVGLKYDITTQQVQDYAAMVGITTKAINAGQVTNKQLEDAVTNVGDAFNHATMAGSAFLSALKTFATSAGGAADRAALIGATLKAANGDALGFAAAMNNSAVAAAGLVTTLKNAASQVGKNGESIRSYIKSIVDLKTGTIDYNKAAAQPLIQGLQQIQDAAMQAAQAQYQHEVSTKGAKAAADDAYKTYVSQTQGQLVDEAKQLGLTSGQAQKLADKYFGMPKDVKTKIETEGTDPVVSVLNKIGQQLSFLTGRAWNATVGVKDAASQAIANIRAALANLNGDTATVTIQQQVLSKQAALTQAFNRAGGGLITGPGTGTSDQAGLYALSNREFVSTAASTGKNQAALEAGNRGARLAVIGMAAGGQIGTSRVGNKTYYTYNGQQYSSLVSAENARASATRQLSKQAVTLRFNIDTKDLAGLRKSLGGTASQIAAQLSKLTIDLTKAANMIPGRQGQYGLLLQIEGDNNRLNALVKRRDQLTAQLAAANTRLSDLQKASAQETQTVTSAVLGGFNITTAGQFQVGGQTYGNAAGILANLRGNVAQAKTFASQLAALRRRGLSKVLLQQLGEAGYAGAGANVAALSKASNQQLRAINNEYTTLIGAGMRAGQTVSNALYGQQIAQARAVVNEISKSRNATVSAIKSLEGRIEQLARALANRPVVLEANARELARVVNNQNAANRRR